MTEKVSELPLKGVVRPLSIKQKALAIKHGFPAEFKNAVYRALGEISLEEAEEAIRKYQEEWDAAAD